MRREKMESDFADLISKLAPERRYMRLFKEIVRQVWKQRQTDSDAIMRVAKARLDELRHRKSKLVEFLLDARLDQNTYDEEAHRLSGEMEAVKEELAAADLECLDVEAVLEFAEKLIERPKALWLESSPDHRQRLQDLFFPDGVTYNKEGFGTAASHSFVNVLISCYEFVSV